MKTKADKIVSVAFPDGLFGNVVNRHVNITDRTVKVTEYPNVEYETIPEFVTKLEEIDKRLSGCLLDMELEYGTYGDNDSRVFAVNGWRPLTEEEECIVTKSLEAQRTKEKDAKEFTRQKELREYERLRAKFGDSNHT